MFSGLLGSKDGQHCSLCAKPFNVMTWKYSCAACGHNFCVKCSPDFLVISRNNLILKAATKAENLSSSRPQRCCVACKDRITSGGDFVSASRNINDDYLLGEQLGKGGTASVRVGKSKIDEKTVAIKLVKRGNLSPQDEASTFREVYILQKIKHQNIVQLFHFYEEPEFYYIVLERIYGGELFDRIVQKTVYSELEARKLVKTLLEAIKFLHDRDIVHRDLKPENLMMTSPDNDADVKIVDFGFAAEASGKTLREQLGTPAYIAPEIIKNESYGKAVDMWSFGVILFILLGGYQPFLVHDRQITLNRIVRGEIHFDPKYWHHVSREAKNLIRGLLTVNQDRRYTVEQALRHEWLIMRDSALETKKVNIAQLKKFQAQKRFRKGVNAVMAANKLKKIAKLVSSLRAENAAVASTKETDEPNGKLVESNISTETDAAESDDEDTADKKLLALENFLFVEEKPSLEMIQSIPHVFKLHYQLGEKIGSGGFAEVKAGININTKEEVAIKVIQTKDAPQPRLEAIRKEASILQDLDHPHIVKLFDFFEEEGTSYMVMEKLNGGELFDRIASKNHFTEAEARELSSTILKAIKHMHSRNIVHRDLKPENLVLTSDSNDAAIKIIDFGFATKAEGFTLTDLCGTISYIAPEIVSKKPYGKPVDMWAFGVILFILLSGYSPFYHAVPKEQLRQIIHSRYSFDPLFWKDISDGAKDLISKLLVIDPSTRLTAEAALRHPWFIIEANALGARSLSESLMQLRRFQAKKKFRAAVKAIMMIERVRRLIGAKSLVDSIQEKLPQAPTTEHSELPPHVPEK